MGHPPIHIPWSEIEGVDERMRWYGSVFRVRTRAAREVDLAIQGRTWSKLRSAFEAAGVRITAENS